MPSLVERCRQIIAAEDDDFFQADTIQYYINKGQHKVVSYMINKERELGRSLRALDNLKSVSTITLGTGTSKSSYFTVDADFPANLNQFENLVYNNETILRELSSRKLYMLEWGNLVPTQYEGYFYITNDGSSEVFRLFLHEDPDTNDLEVYFVQDPTDISLTDETFAEIPDQLENAVLYAAATMMAAQERNEGTQLYSEQYQEELTANIF